MPDGLEAIIFTADGDMRQALNNLQVLHLTVLKHSRLSVSCSRCMLPLSCCRQVHGLSKDAAESFVSSQRMS